MLKNLTVLKKLLLVMIGALAGMAVLGGYALFSLKASMMEERKIKTRHVVESVYGVLEHYHALQKAGKLSQEAAQQTVKETVKALRYEGKEYFWINDLGAPVPKMIMHPTVPSLDGKVLDATKFNCATSLREGIDGQEITTDGKMNLFVAFNTVANKAEHGYVTYMWPKPKQGGGTTEETYAKLSYVKKFTPWGWVIGSGVYIDDINAAFRESALKFAAIIAALSTVIGLFIFRTARAITLPLAHGVKAAQGIAEGDIEVNIPVESGDEIGQLMQSLRAMQGKLRHIVEDIRSIVAAAVDGDFSRRIEIGSHQGFARELAENLNRLNEITHVGLSDVMRVASACAEL